MKEFSLEKAGRPDMIDPAVEQKLLAAFRRIRASGTAVDASLVAAIAMGLQERAHRGSTSLSGGALTFSCSWAAKWMHSHDINVRRATTDRTVPNDVIVREGKQFYESLSHAMPAKQWTARNTYNMDEFFCHFDPSVKGWTWEHCPKGQKQNIVIKDSRAGFTCSVTTAASGEVVLLQFIHKGSERVHVQECANLEHVLQCHRKESHFQNEETFREWCDAFLKIALWGTCTLGNRIRRCCV